MRENDQEQTSYWFAQLIPIRKDATRPGAEVRQGIRHGSPN